MQKSIETSLPKGKCNNCGMLINRLSVRARNKMKRLLSKERRAVMKKDQKYYDES